MKCLFSNLFSLILGIDTALFAHHPEKKIIKKIVDRRPKKHRLSDINRKNINLDICITKIPNAPADYTIITAAGEYSYKSVLIIPMIFYSYIFLPGYTNNNFYK